MPAAVIGGRTEAQRAERARFAGSLELESPTSRTAARD
jgi:hypothetical protein